MDLQTHIRPELWSAISNTYQAGNYKGAIVDAMLYLTNVLREKTGLDGDGPTLVGQALGGDSPRLRITKLQTETERNIQKGFEQILRGLYQAVRHPRHHEQAPDTKDTADSIIYFIDYISGILGQSEEPFTLDKFLARVFDPYFVESEQYAERLVERIPAKKLVDTLIEIYRKKTGGDSKKLAYSVGAIIEKLSDEQIAQFLAVVSDELETTQEEEVIRLNLQILPPKLWSRINEVAKLRTENRLLQSIKEGKLYLDTSKKSRGALGTWAGRILQFFTLKREVCWILTKKLASEGDADDRRYVVKFFWDFLPEVVTQEWEKNTIVEVISGAVRDGDSAVRGKLIGSIRSGRFPEEWQKEFAENLKDLTDPDNPAIYLPDGTPFLKGEAEEVEPADIPF
jgi:uncharacterized protein (TIGR02391 family)